MITTSREPWTITLSFGTTCEVKDALGKAIALFDDIRDAEHCIEQMEKAKHLETVLTMMDDGYSPDFIRKHIPC